MTIPEAFETYQQECQNLNVTALALDQWQFVQNLMPDEFHIPYLSATGNIWTHDMRKKTRRTDRPLGVALALAKP